MADEKATEKTNPNVAPANGKEVNEKELDKASGGGLPLHDGTSNTI